MGRAVVGRVGVGRHLVRPAGVDGVLRDALAAPRRSTDAVGTTVVGAALTAAALVGAAVWVGAAATTPAALAAAPVALAPALLLRGYYLRTVAAGLTGDPAAPSFVGWGRLYRDGLKSVLLSAAYLLPLAVVVAVGGAAAAAVESGRVDVGVDTEPLAAAALVVPGGFTLAYLVAFAYLRPAGLARFAATGRLRAAFSPRRVGRVAADGDYATAWLLAAGVGLAGAAIAAVTLPLLVGLPVWFTARTVGHSLYGRGAAAAGDGRDGTGTGAGDERGGGTAAGPAPAGPPGPPRTGGRDPATPVRAGGVGPSVQVGRSVSPTAGAPGSGVAGGAAGPNRAAADRGDANRGDAEVGRGGEAGSAAGGGGVAGGDGDGPGIDRDGWHWTDREESGDPDGDGHRERGRDA